MEFVSCGLRLEFVVLSTPGTSANTATSQFMVDVTKEMGTPILYMSDVGVYTEKC
jgi:hypothetical protein